MHLVEISEKKKGILLPIEEIVQEEQKKHTQLRSHRSMCSSRTYHQTWMQDLYENICREIKIEVPNIHIHGFSPEEILYGATRSNVSTKEYLSRLKDAGVDTIPGTCG